MGGYETGQAQELKADFNKITLP